MHLFIRISRYCILGIMGLIWLIVGLIICLVRPRNPNNVYIFAQMLSLVPKVIGVKLKYHFDPKSAREFMPAVFIGVHQSNWDIVVLSKVAQPGMVCVGKKSLIYTPAFGQLFLLSGNILLDRKKNPKERKTVQKMVEYILKYKRSIWIFPEGTRSCYGAVGKFNKGAFYTAFKAQVPILPYVISTYADQIDLGRLDNGEIHVKFMKPVYIDEQANMSYTANIKDSDNQMEQAVNTNQVNIDNNIVDSNLCSKIEQISITMREQMIDEIHKLDREVRRPRGYQIPPER